MALNLPRSVLNKYCFLQNITAPAKWSVREKYPIRTLASGICYQNPYIRRPVIDCKVVTFQPINYRLYSTPSSSPPNVSPPEDPSKSKPGIIQRFKQMYRDYWYVLIPVHVATSIVWFGSFYYIVRSGVDVLAVLQSIGISESLIAPLRDTKAGYFAIALAMYKLITPLRYAVTIGGTTIAIRKLTGIGLIKPVPSRERMKEIFQEKRDNFQDAFKEGQAQMKEKRTQVMREMKRYKTEMRSLKNKTPPPPPKE